MPTQKKDVVTCNFYNEVKNGGRTRMKQHFIGRYKNAKACKNVPEYVKEEIRLYMAQKNVEKEKVNISESVCDFDIGEEVETEFDESDHYGNASKSSQNIASSGESNKPQQANFKRYKTERNVFFIQDPNQVVQNRKGKQQQTANAMKIEACKKER